MLFVVRVPLSHLNRIYIFTKYKYHRFKRAPILKWRTTCFDSSLRGAFSFLFSIIHYISCTELFVVRLCTVVLYMIIKNENSKFIA